MGMLCAVSFNRYGRLYYLDPGEFTPAVGDRVLVPDRAHVLDNEVGTATWLAGGTPQPLPWEGGPGRPTPAAVRAHAAPGGPYFALRTTLLCLENTHNAAGGTVTPVAEHLALVEAARDRGLAVHLDGARLWNAAVALGVPAADLEQKAKSWFTGPLPLLLLVAVIGGTVLVGRQLRRSVRNGRRPGDRPRREAEPADAFDLRREGLRQRLGKLDGHVDITVCLRSGR